MTDKQVRIYITLLCYAWLEVPRATLPNDNVQLAQLARLPEAEWDAIKGPIMDKFQSDGNGRIVNVRLMEESEYVAKKSSAGKARWGANGEQSKSRRVSKRAAHK